MAVIKDKPDIFGNRYFIKNGRGGRKDYGGYSPCTTGYIECFDGCTLNNCVGGAWGLFAMAEDNPNCKIGHIKSSTYPQDAASWYNNGHGSKWDTYERGTEPREGAVICYGGAESGHVAYVTEIRGDELILLSSGYGNTTPDGFDWRTVKRSQNYRWPGSYGDKLEFQGFIYPKDSEPHHFPDVSDVTSDMAIQKMAEDVIAGYYGNGFMRKDRLYKTIQDRVNQILWS